MPKITETRYTIQAKAGDDIIICVTPFSIYRCRDMGLHMLLWLHAIIPCLCLNGVPCFCGRSEAFTLVNIKADSILIRYRLMEHEYYREFRIMRSVSLKRNHHTAT